MAEKEARVNFRITPEAHERLKKMAEAQGVSQAEVVMRLLMTGPVEGVTPVLETPKPVSAAEKANRYRLRTVVENRDGLAYSVARFVPFETWEPGMSYWTKGGGEYHWCGEFNDTELGNMVEYLLSPNSPMGWAGTSRPDLYARDALFIAHNWTDALRQVMDANAKGETIEGTDQWRRRARWLQFVRKNPGIPVGDVVRLSKLLEMKFDDIVEVQRALTYALTQRNGVFIADYPWHGM